MPQSIEKEKVKIVVSSGYRKFSSAKSSKEHVDGVSYSTQHIPFQLELRRYPHLSSFFLSGIVLEILSI